MKNAKIMVDLRKISPAMVLCLFAPTVESYGSSNKGTVKSRKNNKNKSIRRNGSK